jgi:hypothetical protein
MHAFVRPRSSLPRIAAAAAIAGSLLGPATGRAQSLASIDPKADPMADPIAAPPTGEPLAEPAPTPAPIPAPPPARELTAADVAGAPVPGQESGRLDPIDDGDGAARWIGRGFLFVPRLALQATFAPVRAGIWANERYRLRDRAEDLLFNDARTMGIYPTIGLESGFGARFGARFVHRDLLGAREHFALAAQAGGRYRESVLASLRTGERIAGGRVRLELEAEYDRRPKERFFGIGNLDGELAPEARYRQRLARAVAVAGVRIAGPLHLRGASALTDLEVARSDEGPPIDEQYPMDAQRGWPGARHAYGELELVWDGRRPVSSWEPRPLPAAGWYAGAYGGRIHRLDGGADFWRYGADVQHFLRLGRGPRVLAARAHVEAVSGARADVPFFELPALGGSTLLRGYPTERFRDRIAALGSLDYQWDLSQILSARVFTDVGRVFASAGDLEPRGLRVGYGVGLEAHSRRSFWLRTSLATSIDGGVFLNLSFDPVFELDGRVERR